MIERLDRGRWLVVAVLAGGGLTVAGCGFPGGGTLGSFMNPFGMLAGAQDEPTISERRGGFESLSDELLMTRPQKNAAEDLDDRLADDLAALQDAAETQFLGILDPEQTSLFDELAREFPTLERMEFLAPERDGRFGFFGGFGRREQIDLDTVAIRIDLTTDQRNMLDDLAAQLPEDIRARREAADEEFRALLDPGQLDLLDDVGNGSFGGFFGG